MNEVAFDIYYHNKLKIECDFKFLALLTYSQYSFYYSLIALYRLLYHFPLTTYPKLNIYYISPLYMFYTLLYQYKLVI